MLTDERHRAILRLLAENGRVTVTEIAERFSVSTATARRDAVLLTDAGKATRSHGGLLPSKFFSTEPHFRAKAARHMGLKARLARKAVGLLPHEGNVFIDAGTTCLEVGRLLLDRPDLHVFTNSIPLVDQGAAARATVVSIGGEVRKVSLALTGALAQAWLAHLRFDAAVIGASGLDIATGAYTTELHEGAVKAEALRRAGLRLLVADAEKWDQPTAVHFAPWTAFNALVTNAQVSRDARLKLAAADVKIHIA
jgi:DeoR family fructose operon transcriptional repressor